MNLESALEKLKLDRNDQEAWATLVSQLMPIVRFNVSKWLDNRALIEDAVSSAFGRFWERANLDGIGDVPSLCGYIKVVARRIAFDINRSEALRQFFQTEALDRLPAERDVGQELEEAEHIRVLLKRLEAKLSPVNQALLQRMMAGDTLREASEALGISVSTAWVQKHRIKAEFLRMIELP